MRRFTLLPGSSSLVTQMIARPCVRAGALSKQTPRPCQPRFLEIFTMLRNKRTQNIPYLHFRIDCRSSTARLQLIQRGFSFLERRHPTAICMLFRVIDFGTAVAFKSKAQSAMRNTLECKSRDKHRPWVTRTGDLFPIIYFAQISIPSESSTIQIRKVRYAYGIRANDRLVSVKWHSWYFLVLDAAAFRGVMRWQTERLSLREWQHGVRRLCRKNKPPDKTRKHLTYYEINAQHFISCALN